MFVFETFTIFLVACGIGINVAGLKIMGPNCKTPGPSLRVNVRNYL